MMYFSVPPPDGPQPSLAPRTPESWALPLSEDLEEQQLRQKLDQLTRAISDNGLTSDEEEEEEEEEAISIPRWRSHVGPKAEEASQPLPSSSSSSSVEVQLLQPTDAHKVSVQERLLFISNINVVISSWRNWQNIKLQT